MLTQQITGTTHWVKATFFSLFADAHPMDTEDESDNSIPREITTMASQGSTTLNQDTLSLTSAPQVSIRELAEVTNLVRELQSEII